MLFSLYPTSGRESWEKAIDLAIQYGEKELFCSLHIPEADGLKEFVDFIKKSHHEKGCMFYADISPLTLKKLNISIEELGILIKCGISCLRIDFGFSPEEIKKIAGLGFKIALNASTVNDRVLNQFDGMDLIGWHNYYPRPETGLSSAYFISQNEMFQKHNIPIYTFIPGDTEFRAPLFMGLPVLEHQRFQNVYVNYLEMSSLFPNMRICVAEGIVYERHLNWIKEYEDNHQITIPLCPFDSASNELNGKIFTIRQEQTENSVRLNDTRGLLAMPKEVMRGEKRHKGSIQMDTAEYGRYEGEIHIMTIDAPLHPYVVRIAEIPSMYVKVTDFLKGESEVRFMKFEM